MAFRAGRLLIATAIVGIAGCNWEGYTYRKPCEPDAAPGTCCPVGSHEVVSIQWFNIVCAPDEASCPDAGADAGVCP